MDKCTTKVPTELWMRIVNALPLYKKTNINGEEYDREISGLSLVNKTFRALMLQRITQVRFDPAYQSQHKKVLEFLRTSCHNLTNLDVSQLVIMAQIPILPIKLRQLSITFHIDCKSALYKLPQMTPHLRELRLIDCLFISNASARHLASFRLLEKLKLYNILDLRDSFITELPRSLKSLYLVKCQSLTATCLHHVRSHLTNLEHLSLRCCISIKMFPLSLLPKSLTTLYLRSQQVSTSVAYFPHVKALKLQYLDSNFSLLALCRAFPNVEKCRITMCKFMEATTAFEKESDLKNGVLRNCTELNLCSTRVYLPQEFFGSVNFCENLRMLVCDRVAFDDRAVLALCSSCEARGGVFQSLYKISLNSTEISDAGLRLLLAQSLPKLRVLELNSCRNLRFNPDPPGFWGDSKISTLEIGEQNLQKGFAMALPPSLTLLTLTFNKFPAPAQFFRALIHNINLRLRDLKSLEIDPAQILSSQKYLAKLPSAVKLLPREY